jgi:hypothetical protein
VQNNRGTKMREELREKLNTEITRKQFLQYMAAALLAVFGFNNLLSLLSGSREVHHVFVPGTDHNGFGTRKFGV